MLETITINQWHIKHNEENPEVLLPPICVNTYEYIRRVYDEYGKLIKRDFGPKVGETRHYYTLDGIVGQVVYDRVHKTPCGASCWIEGESNRS